ncbi:MAG: 6,7-dimethyl-8-ribityllumazine synthase [candidate division Zixibacteria bacterium RBG_16_53_22]|nr:MAG: 6,7-dimethyl-8-ribityllumazine synthase [candidate division Zixibacteria bacterium RBG_16_53_22]
MMVHEIGGELNAAGKRFAIIVSRFNDFITTRLKDGAIDCLIRHGAKSDDITVVWVPGSFEVPYLAGKLADPKKYDAVICLGAVIRGQTPHFDYIASESAKGIARIGIEKSYPAIYGVITADTLEQAIERAGTKQGNKGFQAALTAIEMVNLYGKI